MRLTCEEYFKNIKYDPKINKFLCIQCNHKTGTEKGTWMHLDKKHNIRLKEY
jgi:hypothetical protein